MVEIEVDGRKVEVPEGSMVMHACEKLGTFVPHFCYHPKLSIAANCRMCLVDVEKAPKPMPACATPVTQGMIVRTRSERAINAQKGVMEFLLINHPLDCPICDQGGECQLQDLAVGYGSSGSRYQEEKRVVAHKDVGPLISMEEMSRCIHCTRCVRFGQEIAGVMELGMVQRGEHSEITSFVGMSVDSELSGNMIDLCPVGALTSKPFRYSARTWELSRRKSISPHDSTGANLVVQVKNHRVMRVLPLENEAVNEYWIADRDRFSYEGLYAPDRLQHPLLRKDGAWQEASWDEALSVVTQRLGQLRTQHAGRQDWLATYLSPHSILEEMFLAARLTRALGSDLVDFRLRSQGRAAPPWGKAFGLGMPIAALSKLKRALVIGSFLRKDHPLFAARLRFAAQRGAQISLLHVSDDDPLLRLHSKLICTPDALIESLRAMTDYAEAKQHGREASVSTGQAAVDSLIAQVEGKAVLLGNWALQHPRSAEIFALANRLAKSTGAQLGVLGEAANSVGGYLAGALPNLASGSQQALGAQASSSAIITLGIDPSGDCARAASFERKLAAADFVLHLSVYAPQRDAPGDVVLPICPFTETGGSFVNAEGRLQSFHGVVRPLGQSRPAWKVLRVLADLLDLPDFGYDSVDAVREACLAGRDLTALVCNELGAQADASAADEAGSGDVAGSPAVLQVPIYASDPIVRRASALQATADGQAAAQVGLSPALWRDIGAAGGRCNVVLKRGERSVEAVAVLDSGMPGDCVRIPFGPIAAGLDLAQGDRVMVERSR
jgi:NADH-quinone oxidoreductase subunit G